MKICKNCDIEYETGNFCKKCGSKLVEKEDEKLVCSKCGMTLSPDFLFCPKCGTKVGVENKAVSAELGRERKELSQEVKKYTKKQLLQIIKVCEFKNSVWNNKEISMRTILSHDQGIWKRLVNRYNIRVDKNALKKCKTYGDLVNLIMGSSDTSQTSDESKFNNPSGQNDIANSIHNARSEYSSSILEFWGLKPPKSDNAQSSASANDDDNIKSEIRKFIADYYGRPINYVMSFMTLREIGCDNVSKLSWDLQRRFNVSIPEKYDKKFNTVGDVCFLVAQLLKKKR